ncbi:MAG: hypothetical protein II984_06760 [Clostridia bacterium]|nr:hypothetical protein [Clostridia bacterium]
MKTVVRKGVFETNSSSTHAISFKKSKSKSILKDASFEIRSKEAKIVQFLGFLNNAEYDYNSDIYPIDDPHTLINVRKAVVDTVNRKCPSMLVGYNIEKLDYDQLCDIIIKIENSIDNYDCLSSENDINSEMLILNFLASRRILLKFKDVLIDTYAEITNQTKEEALDRIDREAFADMYLFSILDDEEKLNEYIEKNYVFNEAYLEKGNGNIKEFAKQYYQEEYETFKRLTNNRIRCDRYFEQGCLSDCYCGMESYFKIQNQLKLYDSSLEKLKQKALEFLSDEMRFVAKEYWNGVYLEKTGDIY